MAAVDQTARKTALQERIARRALATINTPANARILAVVRTGTVITVATHQPGEPFPYCIDSFRLLTPTERADDADLGLGSHEWTLTDQYGAQDADRIPVLLGYARTFATTVTLAA
ncbi:hypothetical protein [Actinacidiphila rubida]|uniref:Uncharacterized protein n=1 Tax=Actinacidiphila rubida TaxID=310780 RepID=A0A1H8T0D5_9ACTN|nr:hypothetical protein [Actinacidiphila rubida]SEO84034.1 hypothetical protein SAMN05216267_104681 [Actinacidiphila rubida]